MLPPVIYLFTDHENIYIAILSLSAFFNLPKRTANSIPEKLSIESLSDFLSSDRRFLSAQKYFL